MLSKKITSIFILSLILVLFGWLYSRQSVLRLASVEFEELQNQELKSIVNKNLAPYLGVNLLTMSLSDLQIKIQSEPGIKKVYLRRKLPSTIIVKVLEQIPVAVIENGKSMKVIGDDGEVVPGMVVVDKLPQWLKHSNDSEFQKKLISTWLFEVKTKDFEYFKRIVDLEWVANKGLVVKMSFPSDVNLGVHFITNIEFGTDGFSSKWKRLKTILTWIHHQQIPVDRLIALGGGQVVISGVKNLHNLKNELNLKEIVRRATSVQAR